MISQLDQKQTRIQKAENNGSHLPTRSAWHKPTITRIGLKRTLEELGSGTDGFTSTTRPGTS